MNYGVFTMKKLLVVVDYQNDFVDGALGFPGADKIEENILSLIEQFARENQKIVFTMDTHFDNYMETVEGKNLPVPHCIRGTKGWELREKLLPYAKDRKVFEKQTFPSDELGEYVKEEQFDEIYLCGLVSDICVFSNAIVVKAFSSPKTEIKVVRNATSSFDLDVQEKSFDMLKHLHIQVI